MTWLLAKDKTQKELAGEFMDGVLGAGILQIPGAHDSMAGLAAKLAGFKALYLSGAALTASRGLPDLGFLNSEEVAVRARDIVRATQLPLLVDIDTGYGGILDTARAAKEMTEARVAAVQIEDQELPKKCGHLNGKKLVTKEEMIQKIRTVKEVAPDLVVVARTDAAAVEGIDAAISRAESYIEAGADAIFPEALPRVEDFKKAAQAISAPLLANMTEFGRTPYYTAEEFASFGFSMVIYPVTSLRVAAKAYERAFNEIKEKGTQKGILDDMQTRSELYETIGYYDYEALDKKIAKTVLPEIGDDK